MNKSLDAADHAEVRKAAFNTEGNPLMPAFLMLKKRYTGDRCKVMLTYAMTKGEAEAVPLAPPFGDVMEGSLDLTRRPIRDLSKSKYHVSCKRRPITSVPKT